MSEKHDLEQNDSLRDYYKEIGDGMEPPAHLVQAAKNGVFENPAAKPSIHVWRFTKAVACYALGIALFLGTIAFLPRLFEGFGPAGPQVTTTTALTDGTDFFNLPEDLRAEVEAAYVKRFGLRSFPGWLETGGYVHYYGTFNGCVVLYHSSMLTAVESRDIGGYVFSNGNMFTLMAYKDGELLDLEDAYAEGWMTKEDIGKIHQKHLARNDRDADEILLDAMKMAYAKQFGADQKNLTIRVVKTLSDGVGVFVDETERNYGYFQLRETVYGLTFVYPNTQKMLFYHNARYYSLTDAVEQGVISAASVRNLYLEYNKGALQKLEKLTCDATQWDTFTSGKVVFTVHPEFNAYQYTKDDFPYMSLISIEELTPADPDHPEQGKTLLLTMKYDSPKNTLSYVKYLENEPDVYSAMPYGYGQTPDEPDPPVTEPDPPVIAPDPPVTEPVDDREYCVKQLEKGLGITLVTDRQLTEEEIDQVRAFISQKDANLALACTYVPFFTPYEISLYELMYASRIQQEFPDNPYQNDGSMMTVARIQAVVQKFFGIEVSASMWNALARDGATYFPELYAYGFPHTDSSGFIPAEPIYGYRLEDGRWMVHLCSYDAEGDHVIILLSPRYGSFRIDAGLRVHKRDLPAQPSDAP
jgi:hypothetical protein